MVAKLNKWIFLLILAGSFATAGCETVPQVPPPEAVLAGTWTLTPERKDLGFSRKQLVFDGNGVLTQISTETASLLGDPTTIIEKNLQLHSVVSGKAVEILMTPKTFPGDGVFKFNGTFSDDFLSANGTLSTEVQIIFTNTTVSTQQGNATLMKNPA